MLSKEFNLATLRALDLFAPLTDQELEFLRPELGVRTASVGDVIMEAQTPGDELFILLVGEVKVIHDYRSASEKVVATVHPIGLFGEMALLTGAPRSATVVATDTSRFLTLRRDGLESVLHTYPSVCMSLLRHAYRIINELNAKIRS